VLRSGNEAARTEAPAFIRLIHGSAGVPPALSLAIVKQSIVRDLFGIKYPILQGGMLWLAGAELAASVSNAGALGILSPYAGMQEDADPQENLRRLIRQTRKLTDKPFGVNIPLDLPMSGLLMDVLLQEKAKIIITAAGSPKLFTELLRSEGIRVIHVISSIHQAQSAESCKVDAVIAEGFEAAGRLGRDELSLFSLIPQVVNAVSLPVIAAGGIVDARGIAAAIALGADGVQLGTRFVASEECLAHRNYKQAIVDARDTVVKRDGSIPVRILKSRPGAENSRRSAGCSRSRRAQLEGDLENGVAYAGSSVRLIKEILPAAAIIESLMTGSEI
jgi:enoyl-[acyl-carrier protein] reductase II